jgi:hypothetical protein
MKNLALLPKTLAARGRPPLRTDFWQRPVNPLPPKRAPHDAWAQQDARAQILGNMPPIGQAGLGQTD